MIAIQAEISKAPPIGVIQAIAEISTPVIGFVVSK